MSKINSPEELLAYKNAALAGDSKYLRQPPKTPFSNDSCAEKQPNAADFSAQESDSCGFSEVAPNQWHASKLR